MWYVVRTVSAWVCVYNTLNDELSFLMRLLSLQTLEYLCDSPRDLLPETYSKNQDTYESKWSIVWQDPGIRIFDKIASHHVATQMKGDFLCGDDEIKEWDRDGQKLNNKEQHMSLNTVLTPCPLQGPVNTIWIQFSQSLITHSRVP